MEDIKVQFEQPHVAPATSLAEVSAAQLGEGEFNGYLWKRGYKYNCIPTWKRRYCIIKGGYLFKYSSPQGKRPKGSPISITDCEFEEFQANVRPDANRSAEDGDASFGIHISSLTREWVFGADSAEIRQQWIAAFQHAKHVSIKQMMGHVPITSDAKFAHQVGDYLVNQKMKREAMQNEQYSSGGNFVPA
eukprot:TRINITY_DN803_c0_g1_i15.p1 TRINITY_DN803_c0_g1~~TRINITY_DN803_c0_g1_i15.p1  ORF type:complete len:190 (-),score=24.23 TRINITY_DN803_c0_g1_i15:79-648(-)